MNTSRPLAIVKVVHDNHAAEFTHTRDTSERISPSSAIWFRDSDGAILINNILANISSFDIIVPNLVMKTYFKDGGTEKTVLKPDDTFSIEAGLRIAIAKHVGRKDYNIKGIENLAERLSYLKCIDTMIDKVIRQYNKKQKDAEEAARKAEEEATRKAKKAEKAKAKAAEKAEENAKAAPAKAAKSTTKSKATAAAKPTNHKLNITKTKHNNSEN